MSADLVTFTEEILIGKLHFLCSVYYTIQMTIKHPHIHRTQIERTYVLCLHGSIMQLMCEYSNSF